MAQTQINGLATTPQFSDSPNIDAFGRLRVSVANTLFDSQQEYGLDTRKVWDATANGTLAAASSNGSVASAGNVVGPRAAATRLTPITVSATDTHYAVLQSKQYIRYIPGKSQLVFMTGVFAAGASYTANFTVRSSTSGTVEENTVSQSSWNIDKMDGTGPSMITIDLTKTQILFIQAQWLGVGRVILGFDIGGVLYPCHQFLNSNNLLVPYTQTFNLPVRMEGRTGTSSTTFRSGYFDAANGAFLSTTRATTGGTIQFGCCSVQSEGGEEARGFPFSAANGTTSIAVTTRRPVLSIRPKATYNSITNRAHIELSDFFVTAQTNACYWEIVYGGTLTGASFASVSASSVVEKDVAATAITGGDTIISGYTVAGTGVARGISFGAVDIRNPLVLAQIDSLTATQTPVTLVCTAMTGTSDVTTAINWHEQTV